MVYDSIMHGWRFRVYNSFRELGGQILFFSLSFLPSLLPLPIPISVFSTIAFIMRICIIGCFMPPREQWNFSAREIYERFESEPSLPHASCVDLCRVLSCLINRISARTVITSSTVAHPQPCNLPWFDIFRGKSISRHCAVSLYETLSWEIHKLNSLLFNYVCAKLKKLLIIWL